jgi:hypothetical protein
MGPALLPPVPGRWRRFGSEALAISSKRSDGRRNLGSVRAGPKAHADLIRWLERSCEPARDAHDFLAERGMQICHRVR